MSKKSIKMKKFTLNLSLLVLILNISTVKYGYAVCPTDTRCVLYEYSMGQTYGPYVAVLTDDFFTGSFDTSTCYPINSQSFSIPIGDTFTKYTVWQYYSNNGGITWTYAGSTSIRIWGNSNGESAIPVDWYQTSEAFNPADQGLLCPGTCSEEIEDAIAQCGDATHFTMDADTCEWSCTPTDNCMEEYNALVATCGDAGIKNWNNQTCWGECDNPCNKEDPCPDIVQEFIEQCGGEDLVEAITCDADFDTDGCLISVNAHKLCKEAPENCDQYRNYVNETCGGSQYVAAYYCNDYDFDNKFYECSGPTTPEDDPPDPGEPEPTDDPEDPDTDDPQDEPDPESTDSDTLKDIEQNTRSTVKNTQEIAEQQVETNQTLDWIGDNTKIIADNTAKIEESIDDLAENLDEYMGNDKILEELEGIGEGIEDLEDAIQGETGPVADLNTTGPGEYEVEEHDFGSRTSQFFDEMKTTGLFAVPTSFFDSIPGGGTSQFVIDGGDTFGTHTLDFSDYSTGLLALRAVIQIAFMWLAIRIVTLKR